MIHVYRIEDGSSILFVGVVCAFVVVLSNEQWRDGSMSIIPAWNRPLTNFIRFLNTMKSRK